MTVSKPGQEPRVYVNGRFVPHLRVVSIEHSMGGKRLDQAVVEVDFGMTGDTMSQRRISDNFTGESVEITVQTPRGEKVVHWGKFTKDALQLNEKIGERLVSTTEHYHFGDPLRGYVAYGRTDGAGIPLYHIDEPLIFNPMIDGRLRRNMMPFEVPVNNRPVLIFIDPGQTESQTATDYHMDSPGGVLPWTLARAVDYLFKVLNPFRNGVVQNILPLTTFELESILIRNGRQIFLQHTELPNGWFIPQCLDKLLTPYGFGWSVQYIAPGVRSLDIHELGRGFRTLIPLQGRGALAAQETSAAKGFELTADNSRRLNNTFLALGSRKKTEITVKLIPAWSFEEGVTPTLEQLSLGSDFIKNTPRYGRWYRDFVLNEAGDYVGNRVPRSIDTIDGKQTEFTILTKPFDWQTLFPIHPEDRDENAPISTAADIFAPRRRRFLPCVSLERADGTPAYSDTDGVFLEWSSDAGQNWDPVTGKDYNNIGGDPVGSDVEFEVLEKECGIRFTGEQPPQFLYGAGSDARLRITATVEHDAAVSAFLAKPNRMNPDIVPVVIDVKNRFHWREIHPASQNRQWLPDDGQDETSPLIPGTADDRAAILVFVQNLEQAWNAIDIAGEIPLEGLEWTQWKIGDVVIGIAGRDITLSAGGVGRPKNPQIVGLRYDVKNQQTTLTLDTWRDDPR